jgi:hypothetical protein
MALSVPMSAVFRIITTIASPRTPSHTCGWQLPKIQLQRTGDKRPAIFLAERPWVGTPLGHAEAHTAQAQARDLEAGPAEIDVLHV